MHDIRPPNPSSTRRVLLYSGHMIDAPGRARPRFPPALEDAVAAAIGRELAQLRFGPGDLAVGSAACGADILVAEDARRRGGELRLSLPFDAKTFARESVDFAGGAWPTRFAALVAHAPPQLAPEALGPLPEGVDPYERTNVWMLSQAQRLSGGAFVFLGVWNGEGGDGPGGVQHMVDVVRNSGGQARLINPGRL